MFKFSPDTRQLVTADCDIHTLRRQAIKDGLQPLRLSGANKVAKGVTTVEEVLRVAPPPLDN
jgi:general secretion pathway protein E